MAWNMDGPLGRYGPVGKSWENAFDFSPMGIGYYLNDFWSIEEGDSSKLLNWLEQSAYRLDFINLELIQEGNSAANYDIFIGASLGYDGIALKDYQAFIQKLNSIAPQLAEKGIDVSLKVLDGDPYDQAFHDEFGAIPNGKMVSMGFKFTDPEKRIVNVDTATDDIPNIIAQKKAELCSDPNGTIFSPGSGSC